MKKHIAAFMVAALTMAAASAQVAIERETLGSGEQGVKGFENSTLVLDNDIFHAPQYLPYHPTAATIWPRVVEVNCVRVGTSVVASYNRQGEATGVTSEPSLKCEGYNWLPKMGRGEYLFFKPRIVEPVVTRDRIIIKEVPVKKLKE